jgi:hypothetical protein
LLPDADHAQVERDGVLLAVDLVHAHGAGFIVPAQSARPR